MSAAVRTTLSWIAAGLFLGILLVPVLSVLLIDNKHKVDRYPFESATTLLLVAFMVVAGVLILSHPFWGPRVRSAFRTWFAKAGLALVFLFLIVSVLDGVAWKDANPADSSVAATRPRSLLDRAFSAAMGVPEYKFSEKSYSAPFASHEFVDREIELTHKGRHILGTNISGKDTLYTMLKGCKPAMSIGVLPLLFALPLGVLFGIVGGFFGKRIDDTVVYVYSTLSSIPSLLLLLALVMALGHSLLSISFGLGVVGWVGLCRMVRGETMKLREMEYVQAAVCLGTPTWRILLRHILPNLLHIVIILAVLAFSGQVLAESILAYLGLGLDNSWGSMIDGARSEIAREPAIWWNLLSASTALFLLVLAMNIVGDVLRDALDPRMTSKG